MKILIGSQNAAKVAAAEQAVTAYWPDATVTGVSVPSHVSDMPASEEETIQGALNRATACHQQGATIGLGIESGFRETAHGLFIIAWAASMDENGRVFLASAGDIPLPQYWQEGLRNGAELRPFILQSGLPYDYTTGAVGFLTQGHVTRDATLTQALKLALAPIANAAAYTPVEPNPPAPRCVSSKLST